MTRSTSLVAAITVAALALAPALADARAGGGSSMGSRGARTYSAPAATNTAPSMAAPMERSVAPRTSPGVGSPQPGAAQPSGGFMRGGFGTALMGGLLGAGIGGLLFGNGLFGSGGFGFIGFLLQIALLFFVGRWLFRMFTRRPAMAGAGMGGMGSNFARLGQAAPGAAMGGGGSAARPVAITAGDYQAFEQTLQEIQAAWSAQDLRRLQAAATPEMVGYFGEQLAEQSSRGVRNTVTDVTLQQGDLSEAWSEGNREYATVAMRFSAVDVTRDSTGRVVDGSPTEHTSATELWTFVRSSGGRWILSAIQQAR